MIAGFTGTRVGMSINQQRELRRLFNDLNVHEIHHGDCLGADLQADQMAFALQIWRVIHPPVKLLLRAFCKGDVVLPSKAYRIRNQDIVNNSHFLIAAPRTREEELRSGTWLTVRYARRKGKKIYILVP